MTPGLVAPGRVVGGIATPGPATPGLVAGFTPERPMSALVGEVLVVVVVDSKGDVVVVDRDAVVGRHLT